MHTYWLDAAAPTNENSNELAIHKMEIMVQEILSATHSELEMAEGGNGLFSPPMSPGGAGRKSE